MCCRRQACWPLYVFYFVGYKYNWAHLVPALMPHVKGQLKFLFFNLFIYFLYFILLYQCLVSPFTDISLYPEIHLKNHAATFSINRFFFLFYYFYFYVIAVLVYCHISNCFSLHENLCTYIY